jgi:hypothetical protein
VAERLEDVAERLQRAPVLVGEEDPQAALAADPRGQGATGLLD